VRLIRIGDIKENDILARAIMTRDYNILLSEGTVLHAEYIEKLRDLNIEEIYIADPPTPPAQSLHIMKEETKNLLSEQVKGIIEKHTYHKNDELIELCKTADSIIENILEEDKVVETVYDIKERNTDIYEHSVNICSLSIIVALKLHLTRDQIHDIGVGCLLHDIGLRYVTVSYINQNLSNMREYELAEYKKHPVYGFTALKEESWISDRCKNIILYHHERIDGSGYPLRATDIPIECEIVGVCDVFDEMICGIGYTRSKVYEAVEFLKSSKGICYSKELVETLLQFIAVYPVGSQVITNTGELAIVIKQNNQFPERPILRVIKDKDGVLVNDVLILDMIKMHSIFIDKVIY